MKNLFRSGLLVAAALLLPVSAFAQVTFTNTAAKAACTTGGQIGILICTIQNLLNAVVPILMGLGVVYFVWGVVQYVIGSDEEAKTTGRDRIIYGIIGMAIIIGFWGLVNLVVTTFSLNSGSITVPTLVATTTAANSGALCTVGTNIQTFIGFIICLIDNSIIPLIFALAVVVFIWGAVNFFILNGGEEEKRTQGKQFMIWGIIALAVMMSVWGLVGILGGTFGFSTKTLPHVTPPGSTSQTIDPSTIH